MFKIVIKLNICHRFFCIVIICNFLVFLYAIISNHFHNAIYSSIKHDYYPFPLVLSPTFGQLGRPLPEEPFFHIKQCNSVLEKSFNMFLCLLGFSKLLLSFFFLFWCGLTIILRLLSSVISNNVLSFQMSKFFA